MNCIVDVIIHILSMFYLHNRTRGNGVVSSKWCFSIIYMKYMCGKVLKCLGKFIYLHFLHSNIECLLPFHSFTMLLDCIICLYLTTDTEVTLDLSKIACNKNPDVGSLLQNISQTCLYHLSLIQPNLPIS